MTSLSEGLDFSIGHLGHFNISGDMLVNILHSPWGVFRFPFCYMIFKRDQSRNVSYFVWQRIRNC